MNDNFFPRWGYLSHNSMMAVLHWDIILEFLEKCTKKNQRMADMESKVSAFGRDALRLCIGLNAVLWICLAHPLWKVRNTTFYL